jgi:hypothetical protein
MANVNVVALSAEIADEWLQLVINEPAYITAENGDQVYTENAQDLFNEINDHVTGIIEENIECM